MTLLVNIAGLLLLALLVGLYLRLDRGPRRGPRDTGRGDAGIVAGHQAKQPSPPPGGRERKRAMRKSRLFTVAVAAAAVVALAGAASAARDKAKPQSTCPVSGKPIDRDVSTVYDGQKVFFCCPKCVAPFEKDPEAYLARLGEQGQVVASLQKYCPVSGDAISPKVSVDYKGRRVFFCCRMCIGDFQADPARYLPLLGRTEPPAGAGMH